MKLQTSALLVLAGASAAHAGGIERTQQSAMLLFAEGNRVELSYGSADPSLTGTDYAVGTTNPNYDVPDVGDQFGLPSLGVKVDVTDKVALALIYDTPYGADIAYDYTGTSPLNPPALAGTEAQADVDALTVLAKYQVNERASVFGGLRFQKASGEVTLDGWAYGGPPPGGLSGYNVQLEETTGTGYVLGAAYEIPDIALRVALTYNSSIEHDFDTIENINPGATTSTKTKTPSSWNLEFQSGIAQDTLLMGSIRYVKHSEFKIEPVTFTAASGGGLVSLEDSTTYRLAVGRRFSDRLSGSLGVSYEAGGDELVSPLAPSTGSSSVSLGLSYKVTDAVELSGGVSHIWLGDAKPETGTPDMARAEFDDNEATAFGVKIAYTF